MTDDKLELEFLDGGEEQANTLSDADFLPPGAGEAKLPAARLVVDAVATPAAADVSAVADAEPDEATKAPPAAVTVSGAKAMATAASSTLAASLLSIPASLLPKRARKRLGLDGLPLAFGTVVSGLVQLVLVPIVAGALYSRHLDSLYDTLVYVTMEVESANKLGILFGFNAAHFIGFLFLSPIGIACLYMFAESLFRIGGAVSTGHAITTLPVWLVDQAAIAAAETWRRARQGGVVPDTVRPHGTQLVIASCRPRDWHARLALEYDGAQYHLVDQSELEGSRRPYHYRFDSKPTNRLITEVRTYSPLDIARSSRGGGNHESSGIPVAEIRRTAVVGLVALPASLLPARYREALRVPEVAAARGAAITGLAQIGIAVMVFPTLVKLSYALLMWLIAEGCVRAISGFVLATPLASLPLWLVGTIISRSSSHH